MGGNAMSYCRFSEGDVYMYSNLSEMKIVCCACRLLDKDRYGLRGNFSFDTLEEALKHLEEHVKVGHRVPEYAFRLLREEIKRE